MTGLFVVLLEREREHLLSGQFQVSSGLSNQMTVLVCSNSSLFRGQICPKGEVN